MQSKATPQMREIAGRMAASFGVSIDEILKGYDRGVRKNAHTRSDFFWGNSDISLRLKKIDRRSAVAHLPAGCGAVAR